VDPSRHSSVKWEAGPDCPGQVPSNFGPPAIPLDSTDQWDNVLHFTDAGIILFTMICLSLLPLLLRHSNLLLSSNRHDRILLMRLAGIVLILNQRIDFLLYFGGIYSQESEPWRIYMSKHILPRFVNWFFMYLFLHSIFTSRFHISGIFILLQSQVTDIWLGWIYQFPHRPRSPAPTIRGRRWSVTVRYICHSQMSHFLINSPEPGWGCYHFTGFTIY